MSEAQAQATLKLLSKLIGKSLLSTNGLAITSKGILREAGLTLAG